jgi:hypothetical protein
MLLRVTSINCTHLQAGNGDGDGPGDGDGDSVGLGPGPGCPRPELETQGSSNIRLDPARARPSSDFSTLRRAARDHADHQRRTREAADSDPRPKLPPVAAAAAGQ